MRRIPLANSQKFAIVDDEDYKKFSVFVWSVIGKGYVYRSEWDPALCRNRTRYLHREIKGNPPGKEVDHRDGNKLNNRKKNLRKSSSSQNKANSRRLIDTNTGFKGVMNYPHSGYKYKAYIKKNKKMIYLGLFNDPIKAAKVRDKWARKLFGEFARLNFPMRFPRLKDGIAA